MRALRAIAAILGAAAGLDAEQARGLDMVRIEILTMKALRPKHQIGERQGVKRLGFRPIPVPVDRGRPVCLIPVLSTHASHKLSSPIGGDHR